MSQRVWTTGSINSRVHKDLECTALRASAHRTHNPFIELDLSEVVRPNLCRRCWKDRPKVKVWHPRCTECAYRRPMPCEHNGAVLVEVAGRDGVLQRHWVWPENAWQHSLVNPVQ